MKVGMCREGGVQMLPGVGAPKREGAPKEVPPEYQRLVATVGRRAGSLRKRMAIRGLLLQAEGRPVSAGQDVDQRPLEVPLAHFLLVLGWHH